ncbi:MAG: glycosyltransferase family 4 protein, partial [Candidatus Peribacteraceae bacterium]|nr:glycosyltransferase family 4 protein [Candidatus Peribacteraceae bacterium]
SEYEGFGMSAVEAMSAGIPVVLSDIESFRNFIDNGNNGFIVDFSDSKISSKLILSILNKDLSKISKNAKKTAAEYGWKNIIEKIEDVYEKSI